MLSSWQVDALVESLGRGAPHLHHVIVRREP